MLDRKSFFIKEHSGIFKMSDTYDILDPESQQQIGVAREEVSAFSKVIRMVISKGIMPTEIKVYTGTAEAPGELQFSLRRSVGLLRPKVRVFDSSGHLIGTLRSKAFSMGVTFIVEAPDGQELAMIKGNWKGWDFKFLSGDQELGQITKKWAGLGKEMFTSADNYIINIDADVNETITTLFLAGGFAIDTIHKEE